jgi:hypothetical protein
VWRRAATTAADIPGEFSTSILDASEPVAAFDKMRRADLAVVRRIYPTPDARPGGALRRGWLGCNARVKVSAPCYGGIFAMSTNDKKPKKMSPVILALLGVSALCSEASAQQPSQAQISAVRSACRSDYMAHCSSVPTGGKASLACLQKNMAALSPSCKSAVNAIGGGQGAAAPPSQPVAEPAESAPAGSAPPAPASVPPAASREYPPLSPRQELAVLRGSCGPDYRALCGDVAPGGGRIVACLRENGPSLSPRCRGALMGARRR